MLGFVIVGCGMIARFHARALADVPGAKLVGVVSRSVANAQKMKDELGLECELATDDTESRPLSTAYAARCAVISVFSVSLRPGEVVIRLA